MFNKFKELSLRSKVVLSMTLLILVYSLIFVGFMIQNAENKLHDQMETSQVDSVYQFNDYINSLQQDLLDISSLPYSNHLVMDILTDKQNRDVSNDLTYINDFLFSSTLLNNHISFAGLINEGSLQNGYYISQDNSFGLNPFSKLKNHSFFQEINTSNEIYKCYKLEQNDKSIIQQNLNDKILFLRLLQDPINNFQSTGYILLGVNLYQFEKPSEPLISDHSGILIYDKEGQLLYENGKQLSTRIISDLKNTSGKEYKEIDSEKYFICSTSNNSFEWKIVSYEFMGKMPGIWLSSSVIYIVLVAIAAILSFIILASLFTSALTLPLRKLSQSMKKFQEGDFEQQVPITYNDEIGALTEGYNQMICRIRELIEQNYAIKLEEKKAELEALQSQINPHFLYNTLDLLYWKSVASNNQEVADIVYSLSKLFRLALNKGDAWITLAQEKEFIFHYLLVHKALMSEKLKYDIFLDESLNSIKIPRFILQPLIENSLVHGFKDKTEDCYICLNIFMNENELEIVLKDNGIGMSQELANQLFNINNTDDKQGYAIGNVINRLLLYFKDDFSIQALSSIDKGTTVILKIKEISGKREGEVCTK